MWAALFILLVAVGGLIAACTAALPLLPATAGSAAAAASAAAQSSAPASGEPHVAPWDGTAGSPASAAGERRVFLAIVANGEQAGAAPSLALAPALAPNVDSPLPTPTISVDALLAALSQTVDSAVALPIEPITVLLPTATPAGGLLGAVNAAAPNAADPDEEAPADAGAEPAATDAAPAEPEPAAEAVPEPTSEPTLEPTAEPAPAAAPSPVAPPPAELASDGQARTLRVPVLMYHYLSEPPADADIYRRDLSVAPDLFAAHLDRLQAEGYTTITPYALAAALQSGAPLPEKPLLISFDDGYRDNYENAFRLLAERGMVATFFVVTDFIDEQRPEYLTWEMVRAMYAGGMAIESHGRNHATLEGRSEDYLIWQVLGSLETIQFELGVRPRFLSYPAGDYDAETMRVLQAAGYWGAFTTEQGATHDSSHPYELQRLRVRGTTSPDDLMRLLNADW